MHRDRHAVWTWALAVIGLAVSLSSLLSDTLRVFLLCLGAALLVQAVPVWLVGHVVARQRRQAALELLDRVGGRVAARLAADPRRVVELNLSATGLTDADVETLSGLPDVERLDLSCTAVGDEGVEHLSRLGQLRELDLTATRLTDAGAARLTSLPLLQHVRLDQTAVTADAVEDLLRCRPGLRVESAVFGVRADGRGVEG
jgi:hypothetical protein